MKDSNTITITNERPKGQRSSFVGRIAQSITRVPPLRDGACREAWLHRAAYRCLSFLALAGVLVALAAQAQQTGFSVVSTAPADGATVVPVEANIIVKFSAPVDQGSVTAQSVQVNGRPLAEMKNGGVAFPEEDSAVVLFVMKANTVYQTALDAGIRDTKGNALAKPFSWRFATASAIGQPGTPVKVFARYPRHNDQRVPVNAPITLAFTTDVDPASLSGESVLVLPTTGGNPVSGKITVQGRRAVFRPDAPLEPNRTYEVQVGAGVKSMAGLASERASSWQFTTGEDAGEGPAITDCWFESYREPQGLRMVFHATAENLVKPGQGPGVAAADAGLRSANGILKATMVSLSGLVPSQPLSTPADASAKDMPVTNWAPNTVVYAAYTHGGGSGQGNSVAGNSRKDPAMEPVTAAVDSALAGDRAVVLHDSGDVIEDGDEAQGDGVYSGRLSLGKQFPAGQAQIAFSIVRPDGTRTEAVTMSFYVLPPPAAAEAAPPAE